MFNAVIKYLSLLNRVKLMPQMDIQLAPIKTSNCEKNKQTDS